MVVANAYEADGGALRERFEFIPTVFTNWSTLAPVLHEKGPGLVLCSTFMWNEELHHAVGAAVKRASPGSLVIEGGPAVPRDTLMCSEFMSRESFIDVAVRGEADGTLTEMMRKIEAAGGALTPEALYEVPGLMLREPGRVEGLRATAERGRMEGLDALPSPYLTGFFERTSSADWWSATLETNRGCPYGCTFCDWGAATLQKIRQFSMERVEAEIEWIARHKIQLLWVADANFGIFDRDIEIARIVAKYKERYGFPRLTYVNYAKNATKRIAEIVRILHRAGLASEGMIALQTTDENTLDVIRRSNIKTQRYGELLQIFREEKLPVSTDLLLGLPGATPETFKADLQYCFDRGVRLRAYLIGVWPNSPMAEPAYRDENQIELDEFSTIAATKTFSRRDLSRMIEMHDAYHAFITLGTLRHVATFLQADHGILATRFLQDLVDLAYLRTAGSPWLARQLRRMLDLSVTRRNEVRIKTWLLFFAWRRFYREVADFAVQRYGIDDPALATILKAQEAVIPAFRKPRRTVVALKHDVVAWTQAQWRNDGVVVKAQGEGKALRSYGAGRLVVEDLLGLCHMPLEVLFAANTRTVHFELSSKLQIDDPLPNFMFFDELQQSGPLRFAFKIADEYLKFRADHFVKARDLIAARRFGQRSDRISAAGANALAAVYVANDISRTRLGIDLIPPERVERALRFSE